jgi:hypothetical protein
MSTQAATDQQAFRLAVEALEGLADAAFGGAEALDNAACAPHIKYLAKVGIGAATRGCSQQGWRAEVCKTRGPDAAADLDEAEDCMQQYGLWPWT